MSTVVNYCQRLFVGFSVVIDRCLVSSKDLFDGVYAEVCHLSDVYVLDEAISLDIPVEDFHVMLDCGEVYEAFFFGVSISVYAHEADGRVVDIANDEALSSIWAEVGQAGFYFAEHCWFWWSVFFIDKLYFIEP